MSLIQYTDATTGNAIVTNQNGYTVYWDTNSGVSTTLESGGTQKILGPGETTVKELNPKLYFSFVKSKFNKLELKELKTRLSKLQKLVSASKEIKQIALYEELSKELYLVVKEQEIASLDIFNYVSIKDISKFKDSVKDKVIKFKELENFPRPIPAKIRKIIKTVSSKGVFDKLWVLFGDYTDEEIKTNEKKIREKDPILFGQLSIKKDRYYHITEWVDEYCDLKLTDVVETLNELEDGYDLKSIPDMKQSVLDDILREVKEREERLEGTNSRNYIERAKEAADAHKEKTDSWVRRIFKRWEKE